MSASFLGLALVGSGAPALGQAAGAERTETVRYLNPADDTRLSALLTLPPGSGPHPVIILLSVAGTNPMVDRLVADGYGVLAPTLRGFVEVEPLLRATFADLASDIGAALSFLAERPEVDLDRLALIAQSDLAPPVLVWAAGTERRDPLALLAPPVLTGVEVFRAQQRWLAENQGAGPTELAALDRYVDQIADVVLGESTPYAREYRLRAVRARSRVQLPRNAEFPEDDRQAHFFASPLWHDRMAFEPGPALAAIPGPVLIVVGTDDPRTSMSAYLEAARDGLAGESGRDAATCRVPGRVRHAFPHEAVQAVTQWISTRLADRGDPDRSGRTRPSPCLDDEEGGR